MSSIKVYADELKAVKNSNWFSNLVIDSKESSSIDQIITDFQSLAKGRLVGDGWDNANAKLTEFQSALLKRIEIANSLSDAIIAAVQLLTHYMEDYPQLDLSQLDEIKATKQQCEDQIALIKQVMYSTKTEYYKDADGVDKTRTVRVYSDAEIASFSASIAKLEANIEEIKKLITKLEGLEAVYNEAQGILDEAFASINAFGSSISNIVPNNKVVYVK